MLEQIDVLRAIDYTSTLTAHADGRRPAGRVFRVKMVSRATTLKSCDGDGVIDAERLDLDREEIDALAAKLHRLLEFCQAVTSRYAHAQVEQGAHMTSIGESLAGRDVCSPTLYRFFERGYPKRLIQDLRTSGIRLAHHICGDATKMVETGASVLELDYEVDMPAVKAATKGRATILGPVDPRAVLALGKPDDVDRAAREAIEVLSPGGGFILGPWMRAPPGHAGRQPPRACGGSAPVRPLRDRWEPAPGLSTCPKVSHRQLHGAGSSWQLAASS